MNLMIMNKRQFWSVIGLIALITFALRLSQISHGLPNVQMGDENADISLTARMLLGELRPNNQRYTRGVISTLETFGFAALYVDNLLKTGKTSLSDFREYYFANRSNFTWMSRFLVVIIMMLGLFALADLMRRVVSPIAGILAVILMCFYYLWNLHSIYAMPDTLIATALVLFCWAFNYLLQVGTWQSYALAGITLAFVWLSKLSIAPTSLIVVLAHSFRIINEDGYKDFVLRFVLSKRLLIFVASFILGNIILNPTAFVYLNDLVSEFKLALGFAYDRGMTRGITEILGLMFNYSGRVIEQYIGLPLLAATILGVIRTVVRRKQAELLLLIAGCITWLAIARITLFKASYWIPIFPFIVFFASIGCVYLLEITRKSRILYVTANIIILILIVGEVLLALDVATKMRRDYTFTQAQEYIEQNWAKNTRILMGLNIAYSVPIQRNESSIVRARQLGAPDLESWSWWLKQVGESRQYEYDIFGPEYAAIISTFEDVSQLIRDEKINYIIEVDYCLKEAPKQSDPTSDSAFDFPPLNQKIKEDLQLVATFTPFVSGTTDCLAEIYDRVTLLNRNQLHLFYRPGPIIKLYQVKQPVVELTETGHVK